MANSEFSNVYVNPDSGTDKSAWAQTIHSGVFDIGGGSFSGWWDVQDSQIALHRQLLYINEWAAANALSDRNADMFGCLGSVPCLEDQRFRFLDHVDADPRVMGETLPQKGAETAGQLFERLVGLE